MSLLSLPLLKQPPPKSGLNSRDHFLSAVLSSPGQPDLFQLSSETSLEITSNAPQIATAFSPYVHSSLSLFASFTIFDYTILLEACCSLHRLLCEFLLGPLLGPLLPLYTDFLSSFQLLSRLQLPLLVDAAERDSVILFLLLIFPLDVAALPRPRDLFSSQSPVPPAIPASINGSSTPAKNLQS